MTYPPQQPDQPPIVAGPPQSPTAWTPEPAPAPPKKSRAVPILIGAVAVLVLAVVGLGYALLGRSGNKQPAAAVPAAGAPSTVAATVAATPAAKTFSSAAELRSALVAGGIACNNAELIKHDGKGPIGLIDDTISCYRSDAELDLDVYDSAENASGRVAYQAALLEGFGLDPGWFAVGENWTVQCETRADCEDVAAAIGGRVESTA